MYCGRAEYKRRKKTLLATEKPVLVQVNGKDTIYMRADTFYSAPMVRLDKGTEAKSKKAGGEDSIKAEHKAGADSSVSQGATGINETLSNDTCNLVYTSLAPYAGPLPKQDVVDVKHIAGMAKTIADKNKALANNDNNAVSQKDTTDAYSQFQVPPSLVDTIDISSQLKYPDIRRDTVWSIPGKLAKQRKGRSAGRQEKKSSELQMIAVEDTSYADSTAPLYFIGYHHVRIFSDSLQGKCDSVSYTRSDSTIRMIYKPIAWAHNSQVTGDTILMQLDSNQLRRMYVPNNAFVVSQSGPPKALLYDQVQGKTLTAYFKDNTITHMVVFPDAECIYYSKDGKNAYLGVNQANSIRMRVYFDDQKIKSIKFEQDVHQVMSPLDKVDIPTTRLSRFKWLIEQRPKTKEELFE